MSIWTGLAAAGLGIVLVLVSTGQALWYYQNDDAGDLLEWNYNPFVARERTYDNATGMSTFRNYSYEQLALASGPNQPNMAALMGEAGLFLILGIIAGIAGVALSVVSRWKSIRGIFAGVAFLAAFASILYAAFVIILRVPDAARTDVDANIFAFAGRLSGQGLTTVWNFGTGWYLLIGSGLAFIWACSDHWHLRPAAKPQPMKVEVTLKRPSVQSDAGPPPPPVEVTAIAPEPAIEEVFLIGSNGLLIKHMARSLMTDKDRDVVGGMISAISSFVREAFLERDGEVHEVSLGDHRFVMANDRGVVIAILVRSGETKDVVHRLKHLLAVLHDRYGERLAQWSGESLEGIEDELSVLWETYRLPPPPTE